MDTGDDSAAEDKHDPYAPFRLVHYRRYLMGGIMASAAAEMQVIAVGWELYERTRLDDRAGAGRPDDVRPAVVAHPAGGARGRSV